MTAHTCTEITPGCYRCGLNLDEMAAIQAEDEADAQSAWITYRNELMLSTSLDRRQIRRREFVAGFITGRQS